MDFAVITTLNALSYGLLLFMLAAGLTLVFSLMGVMNFAHSSLYMLGAYIAFSVSSRAGFWVGLIVAPIAVALIGMVIERYVLRHLHARGHIPELLFTFGLVLLIEEIVKLVWGLGAVDYRVPPELRGALFDAFGARFPMHKAFVILVALASFAAIWWVVARTRTGLVVRAALANPGMVESLGHDVGRIFTLVFGLGVGLAGLAGAVGGAVLVTEPAMAAHLGTIIFVIVVVGGLGSIKGAFIASLMIGALETFLIASDLRGRLAQVASRSCQRARCGTGAEILAGRAHHALSAHGRDAGVSATRPVWRARGMSIAAPSSSIARTLPVTAILLALVIAAFVIAAPLTGQRYWLTLAMQVAVLSVYAYSYQLLFGRTGMLSFGHAVYFGLGAFAAAHAMNSKALAAMGFPAEAIPLIGMASGFVAAVVFGFPATRRSGTPFAMVTLGIGELVAACFLMFPGFFGGEVGISTNRAAMPGWFVASYGRAQALYPLVIIWTLLLVALALWIARTPLGLLARAVRDNAERVGFLGHEAATIRFKVFLIAGPIAGGGGALAAMLYEIVSVESVNLTMSANVLLMTVVGGSASGLGPMIGAVALTVMQTMLSKVTHAWVFYYGLLFILVVLFAPNGLTGIARSASDALRTQGLSGFVATLGRSIAAGVIAALGGIAVIETLFFRPEGLVDTPPLPAAVAALAGLAGLAACFWLARRHGART